MNEEELMRFETELRRLPAAPLPPDLLAHMRAAKPGHERERRTPGGRAAVDPRWRGLWRWLAPGLAVAVAGLLVIRASFTQPTQPAGLPSPRPAGLKADDVQVDHEFVASFDVVATLPGGQPVRFRCRQMRDQWVLADKARGVEIEESRPRVEVTPVRFETY